MNLELGPGDLALLCAMVSTDQARQTDWILKTIRKALNRQPDTQLIKEFEDDFWPNYPRKKDKGHARTAYIRARGKVDAGTVLRGLAAYSLSVRDREERFICLAGTWLNGERWTDEHKEVGPSEVVKTAPDTLYAERSKLEHYLKTGRWLGRGNPQSLPRELLIKYESELRARGVQVPLL
jgi:hypothetical protein